jgi:hypothetical protein
VRLDDVSYTTVRPFSRPPGHPIVGCRPLCVLLNLPPQLRHRLARYTGPGGDAPGNGLSEAVSPLARSKTGALTCRLSATDPRDPKVDAVDWVERIPFAETRNYVQRVMENLQVYRARFGASTATVGPNLHRAATIESRAEPTLVDSIPH